MFHNDIGGDETEVNINVSEEKNSSEETPIVEEEPISEPSEPKTKKSVRKKVEKEKPEPVKIEPVSLDKLTKMVEFSFYTQATVLAIAILCLWGVANVTNPLNVFLSVAIFADGLAHGPAYISSNILGLLYFILVAVDIIIAFIELYVRKRLKHEKGVVDRKLTYRNYLVIVGLCALFVLSVITAITAPM